MKRILKIFISITIIFCITRSVYSKSVNSINNTITIKGIIIGIDQKKNNIILKTPKKNIVFKVNSTTNLKLGDLVSIKYKMVNGKHTILKIDIEKRNR